MGRNSEMTECCVLVDALTLVVPRAVSCEEACATRHQKARSGHMCAEAVLPTQVHMEYIW